MTHESLHGYGVPCL